MAPSHWPRFGLSLLILSTLRGHSAAAAAQPDCVENGRLIKGECSVDAALSRVPEPALTLAEVYEPDIDLAAYLVSEKLDGVRAYWDGRRLITRGGLVINAPAWFTAAFPAVALDGELWMGRDKFAQVSLLR